MSATPVSADFGDCGQPATDGAQPVATDALAVLLTAVGASECDRCICDVDRSGKILATDALSVLKAGVGQQIDLDCVACPVTQTIGPAGGEIVLEDEEARLVIPAGALAEETEITFGGVAPSLLTEGLAVLDSEFSYTIEPEGLELAVAATVEVLLADDVAPGGARGAAMEIGGEGFLAVTDGASDGADGAMLDDQMQVIDAELATSAFFAKLGELVPFVVTRISGPKSERNIDARVEYIATQQVGDAVERGARLRCQPEIPIDDAGVTIDTSPSDDNLGGATVLSFDFAIGCDVAGTIINNCLTAEPSNRLAVWFSFSNDRVESLFERLNVDAQYDLLPKDLTWSVEYDVACTAPAGGPTITAFDVPVQFPEGIQLVRPPFADLPTDDTYGMLPYFTVAGANGSVLGVPLDNGSGGITVLHDFTITGLSTTTYEAVALTDPDAGFDAYMHVSSGGWLYQTWKPDSMMFNGFYSLDPNFRNHTDIRPVGNDSRTGRAIMADFQGNRALDVEAEADEFVKITPAIAPQAFLDRVDGNVISLHRAVTGDLVVGVTNGNDVDEPGDIFIHDGDPEDPVTDIGDAGIAPRRVRCTEPLAACMVTNFGDGTITTFTLPVDGFTQQISPFTIDVGDGPVGGDIMAVDDDGSGIEFYVVTTGFSDDTVTVTGLGNDGSKVDQQTIDVSSDCMNPGHATWTGPDSFIASCNGNDRILYVVLD